jgi:hypothetical protein
MRFPAVEWLMQVDCSFMIDRTTACWKFQLGQHASSHSAIQKNAYRELDQ